MSGDGGGTSKPTVAVVTEGVVVAIEVVIVVVAQAVVDVVAKPSPPTITTTITSREGEKVRPVVNQQGMGREEGKDRVREGTEPLIYFWKMVQSS